MFIFSSQLAEGDLKLLVLTLDIVTSSALSIISNIEGSTEGVNGTSSVKTGCAIASVVVLVFAARVYIAIIIVYYGLKFNQLMNTQELKGTTKYKKVKSFLEKYGNGIVIALGGLLYFFGDNFSPRIIKYAEELHCGQDCIYRIQTAGIIVLGLAIITYLPVLIDSSAPNTEQDNKIPGILLLVPKITNLDLVYTGIERVASQDCEKVTVGSWIYWGIYISFFTATSLTQSYMSHKKKVPTLHMQYKRDTEEPDEQTTLLETQERTESTICAFIPGVFISLFAASFIMADNRLPLACTGSAKDDSYQSKVRVALWGVALVNLVVFGVWYMCKRCEKEKEEETER